MPKRSTPAPAAKSDKPNQPVSLKMLAEYLGLSAATVSFVLNNTPNRSIPEHTRERVRAAAKKFNYQPSLIARSLQGKRTQTIGILLPELGSPYHAQVLAGAADVLMREGYFFFTTHHRHREELVQQYARILASRGAEGFLMIDTHLAEKPPLPAVAVAGHTAVPGVTNIVLDHTHAAEMTLGHLAALGHKRIALMRGQSFSSDSQERWRALVGVARRLKIPVHKELTMQLERDLNSPALGYPVVQELLSRRRDFTAVVCFNDVSAIGCMRALHDAGLRVPQDVSVIGFDDIDAASFQVPSLTTVRQPLEQMGATAASVLLKKMTGEAAAETMEMQPELIERESTGPAPA